MFERRIPETRPATWKWLGVFLILHGLAHALPGMRAMDRAAGWLSPGAGAGSRSLSFLIAVVWAVAVVGLTGGGFGALGLRSLRTRWLVLSAAGATASLMLLVPFWPPFALPGIALDLAVLAVVWRIGRRQASQPPVAPAGGEAVRRRGWRRAVRGAGNLAALLLIAYLGVAVLARPWHMRWGTPDADLHASLPGDTLSASPLTYAIHHAVTIHAPPTAVWPWLAQLGHDRGGFYSYSWLENLFGLHIRNATRIHPEWQAIAAGDTVFATPRGWLGLAQRPGWRVDIAEPGHALFLDKWGAFVLEPVDAHTTRLIVRTRGGGPERPGLIALGPFDVFLFEPVHFLMQRRMLLGIRDRAERAWSGRAAG